MFDLGLTLPFTLGLVTAINPCGFAMLPTWIGYFLAGNAADREHRPEQLLRGLLVRLVIVQHRHPSSSIFIHRTTSYYYYYYYYYY